MNAARHAPRRRRRTAAVVRLNVCLPPVLHEAAASIIARGGFQGMSDYLQARIRLDAGLDKALVAA